MYPIEFVHVQALVRYVAEQVVARFFQTFQMLTKTERDDHSGSIDWFSERITAEIWRNWKDVTTAHQAENQIEDIYNAARTELIRQLQLQGGTVEFGPGDIQPLTDQRFGQAEAWDTWLAHMKEVGWWDED